MRHQSGIDRRDFLKAAAAATLATPAIIEAGSGKPSRRVHILGIDAVDHKLAARMMGEGRLPNFRALAEQGAFHALGSSIPPQSPVAWSDFTVGADAGVHGICDFIHRDPKTYMPRLSMAKVAPSQKRFEIGSFALPLSGGEVSLLRRGTPFWDYLGDAGIPAVVIKLPANFPPSKSPRVRALSGMGTPDLVGSYGTFTWLSSEPELREESVSGGIIRSLAGDGDSFRGELSGPVNSFRTDQDEARILIEIYRDAVNNVAQVTISGHQVVLAEKEWSRWIPVTFPLLGSLSATNGMVRLYLSAVRPHLKLYISPVNIDPISPVLPISTPERYSRTLARTAGRFYTQGMPEETMGLSSGVLDEVSYYEQARIVLGESISLYRSEAAKHDQGLFYFYFSTIDQVSHAMWRQFDPESPMYNAEFAETHGNVVEELYEALDVVLGEARAMMNRPDDVLFVVSDHGFAPFTQQVELNQWLRREGYLVVSPEARLRTSTLNDIDWSKTRAYNIGLNSIYINVRDREGQGIVPPEEARAVAEEIRGKLLELKDPYSGEKVTSRVWHGADIYAGRWQREIADLVVGFAPPYRISWKSAVGDAIAGPVIKVNMDKWSGDHCADPAYVPGVLFSSIPLKTETSTLRDIAPTILALYGLDKPEQMTGSSLV